MICKNKNAKATIFRLLHEGFTVEQVNKQTTIPIKIVEIWKRQNDDYKNERAGKLQRMPKHIFSDSEKRLINDEIDLLLNKRVLVENYKYPETLKSKIDLAINNL